MSRRYGRAHLILVTAGLVALAVFIARSQSDLAGGIRVMRGSLTTDDWLMIGLATGALLLGHVLRAARTKVPIDNVRRGPLRTQFQALAVGYLFDTVLPLRLGEVVRSFLIAKKLHISFLYTLLAVILERLIDVILVASAFLGFSLVLRRGSNTALSLAALTVVLFSLGVIGLFVLLVRENNLVLRVAWKISGWLNADLSNRMRFKIWSVIFGFQRFFRHGRQLGRYALLVVGSWACYVAAALVTAVTVFPALSRSGLVLASVTPYAVISPSVESGAPGQYVNGVVALLQEVGSLRGEDIELFAASSWMILNVPIVTIGLISLLLINIAGKKTAPLPSGHTDGYVNRLLRDEDLSQHFPSFLDSYFQRDRLSQVLHKLEVSGNVSLVRSFKGGSNAVTILAVSNDELYVKKMVPPEYAGRLKSQYDWLAERNSMTQLVSVLREDRADDYYSIDLEYRPNSVPLFEYVHERPLADGEAILADVWSYMYSTVYELGSVEPRPEERDGYVRERFVERVHAAAESHEGLRKVLKEDKLVVNGKVLDNFEAVLTRVRENESAWNDLAVYRSSESIHGDLTIDNILVDLATNTPLLIDPSDDGQIKGPVIDFSRHMQSLLYGYEFLNADEDPVRLTYRDDGLPSIVYRNSRSARYADLADFVGTQIMTKHLSATEQRSVLFHVGLFYGRMLTHRVVINPDTALKYYAVSIRALNRFMDQYELPRS
ncbi:MAG TPA: lysylphosphatidylglycerol synthase domain-containing protein [Actinomycetota bacterium]|nr:lysylphosphatidylglycerol synthase domain-containing protein [Actinomycetota bacterium]